MMLARCTTVHRGRPREALIHVVGRLGDARLTRTCVALAPCATPGSPLLLRRGWRGPRGFTIGGC